ncbi:MAG: AmmeMemoRadiSam system protein B [Candidatus Ancaeobacter aquaticus]|nr:AmmeMemoRadiSam system protein B [Candidatus Ancaeobacter aquaticus]
MNKTVHVLVVLLCSYLVTSVSTIHAESKKVRYPAVAGAFYPYNKERLTKIIDGYLDNVGEPKIKGAVVGVVAPHAGYAYSGQIAAYAFKPLQGKSYDTVVILGPNHTVYGFSDISVYKEGMFKTPLGMAHIDEDFTKKIIDSDPEKFVYEPDLHRKEHAIEVEIPFLQHVLKGDFKIVPVVMGDYSRETVEKLAHAIMKASVGKKVLIVASCDLSHDKDYKTACAMDKKAVDTIAGLDLDALESYGKNRKTEMCGYGPVMILMYIAKSEGVSKGTVMKYANSGDVTGDKSGRIVGYASIVFSK